MTPSERVLESWLEAAREAHEREAIFSYPLGLLESTGLVKPWDDVKEELFCGTESP